MAKKMFQRVLFFILFFTGCPTHLDPTWQCWPFTKVNETATVICTPFLYHSGD